jgi:hypothetical protein
VRMLRGPEAPVFLLSTARTESRLLRTVLATHPEIGSTDGSDAACAGLARIMRVPGNLYRLGPHDTLYVTDILRARRDGHPLQGALGTPPVADLDAFVFADILARRWPRAQFVCLTRHCLDVMTDSAEAVRWGMTAAGLDLEPATPSVPDLPDLTVVARAWLASAQALLAHREAYPERCLEIRYADLAAVDPVPSVARLLDFLGVAHDWEQVGSSRPPNSPDPVAASYLARPLPAKLSKDIDEALLALGYDPIDRTTGVVRQDRW